jgi:hypothetical protein
LVADPFTRRGGLIWSWLNGPQGQNGLGSMAP